MNQVSAKEIKALRIGVVGAGSWGTALANLLALKGYNIDLWVYEEEVKTRIEQTGENSLFLPGIRLSPNLHPSNDIAAVTAGKDVVVVVVPSHVMRQTAEQMADRMKSKGDDFDGK